MGLFNVFNFVNCMIEGVILLLLWGLLVGKSFGKERYLIAYSLLCCISVLVVFINAVSVVIIPLNFCLITICFCCAFYKMGIKNASLHSAFAFLVMLYIQAMLLCVLPRVWLGSDFGNLIVNSITLCIAIILHLLSRKYKWAVMYKNNRKMMWIYILALCIPEIGIMQIFSSVMTASESPMMVSLLLLQILYSVLLLFALFMHLRKTEKRQLEVTRKSIETLNDYLDDSRKLAHDFNKHIRYIRSMVNTQSTEAELIKNVNTYCEDILEFTEREEVLLQLADPMFRALLSSRQMQAKSMGINFSVIASPVLPEFPIANFQLVDIIENLMDNAFECVSELKENRWIKAELCVTPIENGIFEQLLCVQNPYEVLDYDALLTKKGYTTKTGKHAGIGLQNVRKIISDTDGQLLLNTDNHIFTIKVIYRTKKK